MQNRPIALVLAAALLPGATGCIPPADDALIASHAAAIPEQAIDSNPMLLLVGVPPTVSPIRVARAPIPLPGFAATAPVPVRLAELTLHLTGVSEDPAFDPREDGQPDDWSFVQSGEVFLEATIDGAPARVRVGVVAASVLGARDLSFTADPVDVRAWVIAPGGYDIVIELDGGSPPDTVWFDGTMSLRIG